MITNNLQTLKIHKLTNAQYQRELAAGRIDENAIYLTPDEDLSATVDLGSFANKTVGELRAALKEWLRTRYKTPGATATFTAEIDSLVSGWNMETGSDDSIIQSGSQWTVTLDGSYNGGNNYAGLHFASYSCRTFRTTIENDVWTKMRENADKDYVNSTVNSAIASAITTALNASYS